MGALPMKRAPAMKKAMKGASAMKAVMKKRAPAMKTMKKRAMKKRVSKIARGRMSHALVLRGAREKTVGGLTKGDLMRNKRGKVVSPTARKALNVKGFVAINGKSSE